MFAPFGYGKIYHFPTNITVSDAVDPISKEPELKFSSVFIKQKKKRIYKLSDEVYQKVKSSYPQVERFLDEVLEKGFSSLSVVGIKNLQRDFIDDLSQNMKELMDIFINRPADWDRANLLSENIAKIYIKLKIQPHHQTLLTDFFRKSFEKVFDLPEEVVQAWQYTFDFLAYRIFEEVKKHYESEALKKNSEDQQ